MRPVKKTAITQYNRVDYDVLRTYLFTQIGAYCSYCEQPIGNDSAVEHKVPKSARNGFDTQATEWRNVLLACQSCNSAKSDQPSKRAVDIIDQGSNDEDWYLATLRLWVWPDRNSNMPSQPAPPVDEIYQLIRYERSARTQESLVNAGLLRKNWGSVVPAWAQAPQTKTWVLPNDNYINTLGTSANAMRLRVKNTIAGLNLNFNDTDDRRYNDRRVDNRDAARNDALSALGELEGIYFSGVPGPSKAPVIVTIKTVREAALATGFWSVWFSVFREALDNPAAGTRWHGVSADDRKKVLSRTLLYYYPDEQGGKETVSLFPGTDNTRINMGAFS
jgi:hypothetical protein